MNRKEVNIPLALLRDEQLTLNDVRVFAALQIASCDNARTSCTRKELEQLSGVKRVSRHTQNLSKAKYIEIQRHGNENRNTYVLLHHASGVNAAGPKSLAAFKQEYLEYAAGVHTQRTTKTYKTAFREMLRVVGDRPLSGAGIREIEYFLSVKKSEASEWTARKYYIALRSAFEKAVQWEYLAENPFRKVARPKVREMLPAYFSEADFRLFLSAVPDRDFRELCIVALLTGLRQGELLSLRWRDIDLAGKVLYVRNSETFTTKTKRNRVVPMNEELCRLLRDRKNHLHCEAETVFHSENGKPLKHGTVSQKFKRCVRQAGLNDRLHFHSLRHSFATALVGSGVSLYAVQKLLGHTTSKTTEIYSHLLPQQLHEEVNRLTRQYPLNSLTTN